MSLAADCVCTLIRERLEWIGLSPRPYAETLEAWRKSCPRLPAREEANHGELVVRHRAPVRPHLGGVLEVDEWPDRRRREAAWL